MVATRDDALALIEAFCTLPGNDRYIDDTRTEIRSAGIAQAVASRDTAILFHWLMRLFSFQGIGDGVAAAFIARHGNADLDNVLAALGSPTQHCGKLADFQSYVGCRYRKTTRSCANVDVLPFCSVPLLPLRKGNLNEQAFSLALFVRDRAGGDLVGFIDATLADLVSEPDPVAAGREALLEALGAIQGVGPKLASMTMAVLLIGADPNRNAWVAVGQSMVAVDSLVHSFLHRTGILAAHDAGHAYGPRCYGPKGCEAVLRSLADRFDARVINPSYPKTFPRLVQHAIWRFCAVGKLNICNARNIDDRYPCTFEGCPLHSRCAHLPLRPSKAEEAS